MEFIGQVDDNVPTTLSAELVEKLLLQETSITSIKGTDGDKTYNDIDSLWKYFHRPKVTKTKTKMKTNDKNVENVETIDEPEFYKQAFDYWESPTNCPVTDNGVLGGYGHLTPDDARDSLEFLDTLHRRRPGLQFGLAADCGSGIGRVSKSVLLKRFEHVVLVEQSPRLTGAVHSYLAVESAHGVATAVNLYNRRQKEHERDQALGKESTKGLAVNLAAPEGVFSAVKPAPVHNSLLLVLNPLSSAQIEERVCCWCVGLQHLFRQPHHDAFAAFNTLAPATATATATATAPAGGQAWKNDSTSVHFDVVWIQWVVGHLSDDDYVSFFRRCAENLAPGGVIVIKDNVTDDFTFMIDTEDSSVARCLAYHKLLLKRSHPQLELVHESIQRDFPEDLCPVYMMAFGLPDTVQ